MMGTDHLALALSTTEGKAMSIWDKSGEQETDNERVVSRFLSFKKSSIIL